MNELCRCIESEYLQLQWLDASAPDWTGSNFHSHDRGIATFTVKARPPIRCPCNTSIASCHTKHLHFTFSSLPSRKVPFRRKPLRAHSQTGQRSGTDHPV